MGDNNGFSDVLAGIFIGAMFVVMVSLFLMKGHDASVLKHPDVVGVVQVERVGDSSITIRDKKGDVQRLFLNDSTKTPDKGDKVKLTKADTIDHGDVFGIKGYEDISSIRW